MIDKASFGILANGTSEGTSSASSTTTHFGDRTVPTEEKAGLVVTRTDWGVKMRYLLAADPSGGARGPQGYE